MAIYTGIEGNEEGGRGGVELFSPKFLLVGGGGGGTDSPCSHSPSPSPMEKAEAVLRQNIDPS